MGHVGAKNFDGSLIIGGMHESTPSYNTHPINSMKFFPPKDAGGPTCFPVPPAKSTSQFFPSDSPFLTADFSFAANHDNRTVIYDVDTHTETVLPDISNSVRVTNPFNGTATLLPLSPPDFTPEVLQNYFDARGNQEGLDRPRMVPEFILHPKGQVLIINGRGRAMLPWIQSLTRSGTFRTPIILSPSAPLGQRISNVGLPTTNFSRMYHSSVTLTPKGNLFAGSSPNNNLVNNTLFHTEFQVEFLGLPFMTIAFNGVFKVGVSIPPNLSASSIKVVLMDLGFSTHAFHTGSRLVFAKAQLSEDRTSLTFMSPPNYRVYPPGPVLLPAFVFLTVDDVTSEGMQVMVGTGASRPIADRGVKSKGCRMLLHFVTET
ncbi:hypothetical protein JB92DRAFT_3124277 [Gautieria morchelliformis]|nr:hypothetical protein JB92DRAFT_3124277 [Gautieria morchelliformis]